MKVLESKVVKVGELRHPQMNAKMHPRKQIDEMKRSLEMFGQVRPFVVDSDGMVLVGNCMLDAMSEAGVEEANAYIVDGLSEQDKYKLMLADNKVADMGIDNVSVMEELFAELGDFDIPGFDEKVLESVYGDMEDAASRIESYGVVSPEAKAAMEKAEEAMAKRMERAEERLAEPQKVVEKSEEGGRTVVCPCCGKEFRLE